MSKLHQLIEKLRKDEHKFSQFLHDLAHELNPEEVEFIAQHSAEVWTKDEDDSERLDAIAKELEAAAGQVRAGLIPVPTGKVTATVSFEVAQ